MRSLSHVVLALAVAGSAHAQSPAFDAAVRTMGGKDRLLAVRTLVLEGTGEQLNFGQNHTPFADSRFEITAYRRAFDFANSRWFLDQTRVPRFTTANTTPQRLRIGLDAATDTIAYGIGANDVMNRGPAQVAMDRLHELVLHPVGFVRAAFFPGTEISEEVAAGGLRRVRINPRGVKYAMYVDPATNLPVRMERIVYQPMLGDVALLTELGDWKTVNGIQLPMRLTQKYESLVTISDVRLTAATVNADVGNIAATDSIRAVVPQAGAPAAPTIVVDTIAPGVWSVAGQSHHTIAIEQSGSLVLVEAPQNEARTLAAIDAARALRPAKPASLLINTHHHFDHAGGLRAAIAQGFTIVTHDANREFYERIVFPRRHFIQPDRLAQNPRPLRLMPVSDRWVRQDSLRPIEVYAVPSDHAGSMLVVYLPNERILIQADLYNPPAANAVNPVFPFAKALVEAVERRGLSVDRVVGIHGRPVPWSDVIAASQR
jgi:glyoxylase-like metal-dependent hydrolase (beta-lactamase superfamily II)